MKYREVTSIKSKMVDVEKFESNSKGKRRHKYDEKCPHKNKINKKASLVKDLQIFDVIEQIDLKRLLEMRKGTRKIGSSFDATCGA